MLKTNDIIDFFKLEKSHAKKELGQNFLVNEKIASSIVEALEINENDDVLEIGPGLGALSNFIVGKPKSYTLVEYDQKFVNFLTKSFENDNVKIVKNNILKFREYNFNKVIGNLPYYITSDIIEYVALKFENAQKCVFMIQKECLKRFTALSGKDYNALNVLVSYVFDVKELFKVTKENFFPVPNVESIVFSLTKKENIDYLFVKSLYKVSKLCFANRRKTIFNNLSSVSRDKTVIKEALNEAGFKETARAEELSVNDFIKLTSILIKKGSCC